MPKRGLSNWKIKLNNLIMEKLVVNGEKVDVADLLICKNYSRHKHIELSEFSIRACSLISEYSPIKATEIGEVLKIVKSIDKNIVLLIIARSKGINIIDLAKENKDK